MKTTKTLTIIIMLACSMQLFAQGPTARDRRLAQMDSIRQEHEFKKWLYETALKSPCYLIDDDEWFTAFNNMTGELGDPKLANALLQYNQEQLYMKLSGRVKQMTSYYFDYMNMSGDRKASNHIEGLCQKEINQVVMETREACREEIIHPYQQGKIVLFMSIKVRKMDLSKAMEDAIKNDAEAKVRFNEQKFRDAYSKAFEDKQPQE